MARLRSAAFALVFYTGSVAIVLGGLAWSVIDRRAIRATARGWARFHRGCARGLLGIRVRVEGPAPTTAVLVAGKHQSFFEAIDILLLLRDPIVVMKKALVDIPGWGSIARAYGVIAIDREGGAGTLRAMIAAAREAVTTGRPVFIFPEGTRVAPGETPPLQSGFAGLYKTLGLPVVALATDAGKVWPRGFVKHSGTVRYRFGEPIPPGLKRPDVEARVHREINALEL